VFLTVSDLALATAYLYPDVNSGRFVFCIVGFGNSNVRIASPEAATPFDGLFWENGE